MHMAVHLLGFPLQLHFIRFGIFYKRDQTHIILRVLQFVASKRCPKKTFRQRNSFYQYSEALCTQVNESHFQQVPLKFLSNFVTLFVAIPCNIGEMNNFMIFNKIKDLKKLFRKKPPAKF